MPRTLRKCEWCPYENKNNQSFKGHVNRHHLNIKGYKCGRCDFATTHQQVLDRHQRAKIPCDSPLRKKYKCQLCKFSGSSWRSLQQHVYNNQCQIETGSVLSCSSCPFTTTFQRELLKHNRKIHLQLEDIQCRACRHVFDTTAAYNVHFAQVHGFRKCPLCVYQGKYVWEIIRHVIRVHKVKDMTLAREIATDARPPVVEPPAVAAAREQLMNESAPDELLEEILEMEGH